MSARDWDSWVSGMRVAIQAGSIVRQCHDKMARGEGAPDEEDMRRFSDEGEALADLWEDILEKR